MTTPVNLSLDDGITIDITLDNTPPMVVEVPSGPSIEVHVPGPQGPGNVVVGPVNTLGAGTGLWVQTGLGPEGKDFTFWIEDGTIN